MACMTAKRTVPHAGPFRPARGKRTRWQNSSHRGIFADHEGGDARRLEISAIPCDRTTRLWLSPSKFS